MIEKSTSPRTETGQRYYALWDETKGEFPTLEQFIAIESEAAAATPSLDAEQRAAIGRLLAIAEMYTQPWSPATREMLDRYKVIFPPEFFRARLDEGSPEKGSQNILGDLTDREELKRIEGVTVNGHAYAHVAACPCPQMRAEVARLDAAGEEWVEPE